jgi:hypothetical protein
MLTSEVSQSRALVSFHYNYITLDSVYAVEIDLLQPWEQNQREMNYIFSNFEITTS